MVVVRPGRDVLGAVVVAPSRSGVAPGSSGVAHVSTARIHDVIVRHPRSLRREAEAVGHPDLLLIDIVLGLTAEKDKEHLISNGYNGEVGGCIAHASRQAALDSNPGSVGIFSLHCLVCEQY